MLKLVKLMCLVCLMSCSSESMEPVSTAYDNLMAGFSGNSNSAGYHFGGTSNIAGYRSGGTAGRGSAGVGSTAGYHTGGTTTGGTAGTGNTAGYPSCWDNTVTPTPFGDDTEANQAALDGAEAGWTDGYAKGCANDEQLEGKSASAISPSHYFYCWPGGRHRFCVYAAAWATAQACVSLSCEGRTVSACARASAYAFAFACTGARYWWW